MQQDMPTQEGTSHPLTLPAKRMRWNRTQMTFPRYTEPRTSRAEKSSTNIPTCNETPQRHQSVSKAPGKQAPSLFIQHPIINPVRVGILQSTTSPSSTCMALVPSFSKLDTMASHSSFSFCSASPALW